MAIIKHYALLGSTLLRQPDKASLKISDKLNDIPTFECDITNNSANRTALGNINQDLKIISVDRIVVSNNIRYNNYNFVVIYGDVWQKALSITVPERRRGIMRATWCHKSQEGQRADGQIRRNGVPISAIYSTFITAACPEFTEDLTVDLNANDTLELWLRSAIPSDSATNWFDLSFDDKIILTGRIEGEDAIEYISRRRIRLSGYHKMIELARAFFLRLSDSGTLTPLKVWANAVDETVDATNATINDVTIPITILNDAFYIGYSKPFQAVKMKYSTAGVYSATVVWEYFSGCYSEDTEILTENGWKLFKNLQKNEKVATLNPVTMALEYQYPLDYTEKDWIGPMYQWRGLHIDLLVTPDHNMWVRRPLWKGRPGQKVANTKTGTFEFIKAEDTPKYVEFKRDCLWKGKRKEFFELPAITHYYGNGKVKHIPRKVLPSVKIPMNDWLSFFGIWLAEGSTYKGKKQNYRISTGQKIGDKRDVVRIWIKKIADLIGAKITEDTFSLIITNKQLYSYLKKFGKSHDKYIPREFLDLPSKQLKILFDAMMFGDGTAGCQYNTVSKQLADDVQEIVTKIGLASTVTQRKNKIYNVNISFKKQTSAPQNGWQLKEKIEYIGKIYCVTVPNKIIYVRRNGKPCWCGNSGWTALACLDETKGFTKAANTRYIIIPNKPSNWVVTTINGVSAYYIRMRVTGFISATTHPLADQIWIGDSDVARVQYDNIAANTILGDVLAHANAQYGSSYTLAECPATNISLRGEYETHLKWISEIAAALTWTDANGDKHEHDWWVDASNGVHIKQRREVFTEAAPYDISAKLQVLNRKEKHRLGNRIWGLGYGDGINQLRNIREHTGSQGTYGLRDAMFSDLKIIHLATLNEHGDTLLGKARAPAIKIGGRLRFEDFLDAGLAVGDWVKVNQPEWGASNAVMRLMGFDLDPNSVGIEVSNEMETVSSLIQALNRNVDILNKTMQGATNIYQVGPLMDNFERTLTLTYAVKLNIYIPIEVKIINKVLLNWQLSPFRQFSAGSEQAHNHGIQLYDYSIDDVYLLGVASNATYLRGAGQGLKKYITNASESAHMHPAKIVESADENPTMELKVGTIIVGAYTGNQQNIDVTRYVVAGWNTVELYPTTHPKKGRCQLDAVVQCFIESK